MKKNFLLFFLLGTHFFIMDAIADDSKKTIFLPPDGKVLFFVGQDKDTIYEYYKSVGIMPAGVMFYTSIQEMDGLYKPANYGAGDQDLKWLCQEFPDSTVQIGLYMVGALDMVIAGAYDDNIVRLAKFFNNHDRPFYLRIGYEFDSPLNDYSPEKYIEAYRYIVNHLKARHVNNVAYVWHAHGQIYERPPMDWYPGDEYVDWVGVSYFSPYNTDGMKLIADLAKSLNKPLMMAEATPVKQNVKAGEGTWKRWFGFLFRHIDEYNVKAVSYINSYWDAMPMWESMQWGDARVQENPYIKEQWMKTLSDPKYLHGSDELFDLLGYAKKRIGRKNIPRQTVNQR
ncbi:MAG: hypothetical protein KBD53_08125 [Candidatus Omnitrophica bacterium]|nr:hypothetical protein [Candidatus Omnitrophota bacterium]